MLPRVILHNMASVDGRMDLHSSDTGLHYELAARFGADAMPSGSNTILAAFPPAEEPEDQEAPSEAQPSQEDDPG